MPEETVLRCDAPGCDEIGDYETFTLEGRTYEVILGEKHRAVLRELVEWGRPSRSRPATRQRTSRRDTSPQRLLDLVRDNDEAPVQD